MKREWFTISETDGEIDYHYCKLYARSKSHIRSKVDSYEEFHIIKTLRSLDDNLCKRNGFYKLKKYADTEINTSYNSRFIRTPSGKNFINWLLRNRTKYNRNEINDLTVENCIKNTKTMPGKYQTIVPIEKKHLYDIEWMLDVNKTFNYPKNSKPPDLVKEILNDYENYIENKIQELVEEKLSWYEKDGTHFVYVLELYNIKTREKWWYVGQSRALKNRIEKHIKDPPSPFKKSNKPYYVIDIYVEQDGYDNKVDACRREHDKYLEFAIEKNTKNMMGGK